MTAWNAVRSDPFFGNVDWTKLAAKQCTPPILPEDPGPDQCNNFDEDFTTQVLQIIGIHPHWDTGTVHAYPHHLQVM